jgi:hypothetical protein
MVSALGCEDHRAEAGPGFERVKGPIDVLVQEAQDRLRDRPGSGLPGSIGMEFRRVRQQFVDSHAAPCAEANPVSLNV